jgi:hypothetical protein
VAGWAVTNPDHWHFPGIARPKPSTGDAAVVTLLAPGRVRVRWANGIEAAPRPREYAPAVAPSITVRRQEQP